MGRPISARAIASICCSPPLMLPACWSRRSARRGNTPNQRSMSAGDVAVAPGVRAEPQVLLDREVGERAAALRHVRDAGARDLLRLQCRAATARRTRSAPRAGIMPDSARSVVVLPAPLAPRITTTSPSSTVKSTP